MVESVTDMILETFRDLVVEETKFLLGVSGEVEQVKRDLGLMRALLMKADKEQRDSPTLKIHVTHLKDLANQAENVLETYAVRVAAKKEGRKTLKQNLQRYICIFRECCTVHHVGNSTRDVISRLADLTQKLEAEFGRESSRREQVVDPLRRTYAHEVERHFVGMGEDIEALVSMATDEATRQRVVTICGMGGLGKTTLARKVYNHRDVVSYTRAWVCVTQRFQPKTVLGSILKQIDNEAYNDRLEVEDLVTKIYNFLVQRKHCCLIVIDDVWENDHWVIIKQALPIDCNVVITTRFENLANQESKLYKLDFLTEDQGWELLQKIAISVDLAPDDTSLKSLEDIGRQIVVKCGRLPLSISVMGGILCQKKDSLAEWKNVNTKMDSYLRHGEGVAQDSRVKQVLGLSYNALPYHLKPCFLYLACFSEDEEIEAERLYLLWMAEGFISDQDKGHDETLRDVAQRYLAELGMRCMVQVHSGEICSPHDRFDTCRLHDLMHDLCTSKAEEEIRAKRIEISRYLNDDTSLSIGTYIDRLALPSSIGDSVSRLAINVDPLNDEKLSIKGLEELKDLRSFMILKIKDRYSRFKIVLEDSTIILDRSECLRILALDNSEFEGDKLPSKVEQLFHLRYFSLWDSHLRELPQFVCSMPYLQSLDLRVSGVITLPNVIWKMKKLKHLFLSEIKVVEGGKLRLEGLDELETLRDIGNDTARVEDIPKLISLRKLCVKVSDSGSLSTVARDMMVSNNKLCETHLHVKSCDLSSKIGGVDFRNALMSGSLFALSMANCKIGGGGFPRYEHGMCENLVKLVIENTVVGGDAVAELGKYPMLQFLELRRGSFSSEETVFRSNSFPQLKSLSLVLFNVRQWEVEERAMPKLTELFIYRCIDMKKLPEGLRYISTLRELKLSSMWKEFNDGVRRQGYGSIARIEYESEFIPYYIG